MNVTTEILKTILFKRHEHSLKALSQRMSIKLRRARKYKRNNDHKVFGLY